VGAVFAPVDPGQIVVDISIVDWVVVVTSDAIIFVLRLDNRDKSACSLFYEN